MRTTLTLDDDIERKLRQLAHRRRMSFKEAVNAALRRGLAAQERRRGSAPVLIGVADAASADTSTSAHRAAAHVERVMISLRV
jgi:predicted transcriptional regulator